MKLALATAYQVLVELNKEEQQRFGLLEEGTQGTDLRSKLQRILAGVAAVSGRSFRLLPQVRAELLPDRGGGCLLIISGLEEQTADARCCFFAETENDLIDAARIACADQTGEMPVTLLQAENGYYLLTPPLQDRSVRLLSEYMRFSAADAAAEAVLAEHCRVLLLQEPLSALGGSA